MPRYKCLECGAHVNCIKRFSDEWKCWECVFPFNWKAFVKAQKRIKLYYCLDNRRSFKKENEINFKD